MLTNENEYNIVPQAGIGGFVGGIGGGGYGYPNGYGYGHGAGILEALLLAKFFDKDHHHGRRFDPCDLKDFLLDEGTRRDLNNFREKMGDRFADLQDRVDSRVDTLKDKVGDKFDFLNAKLGLMEKESNDRFVQVLMALKDKEIERYKQDDLRHAIKEAICDAQGAIVRNVKEDREEDWKRSILKDILCELRDNDHDHHR